MSGTAITALIPVHYSVQPVSPSDGRWVNRFRYEDRARNEMRFLGYGWGAEEHVYDPSGRKGKGTAPRGKLIDLYV